MPPTVKEFEEFLEVLNNVPIENTIYHNIRLLNERWDNDEDMMAFLDWSNKRDDEEDQEMFYTPGASRAELIELLDSMNYNEFNQRAELLRIINKAVVPWIPAGKDINGDLYRVSPAAYALYPDKFLPESSVLAELSPSVLGVNLNVQPPKPPHRRVANYSEESTLSNESDDSEGTGFVFHQIGILEIWAGDKKKPRTAENIAKGRWHPTRFCAVMRFGRNGLADGVYIIYNFFPGDPITDFRPTERLDEVIWGGLGKLPGRITVAKIADTMSELGFGRTLSPKVIADYPVELVTAIEGWGGSILRATVGDPPRR
ncbi:hypothetical protein FQN49_003206 [Arthroderma sp. PD_2]|nr:hypothetical protein FQN49_003206 [Arthroderma sp. PD_2]